MAFCTSDFSSAAVLLDGAAGHLLTDVQVGFVEGEGLDEGGEGPVDGHDLFGELPVAVEAGRDSDEGRMEPEGGAHGHGGTDAEFAGLVGGGCNNPANCGGATDY